MSPLARRVAASPWGRSHRYPRLVRLARVRVLAARRTFDDVFDDVVVRAEDLAAALIERVRERVAEPAPSAPTEGHPGADEWAAWARENLPAEDAEVFEDRAKREHSAPAH